MAGGNFGGGNGNPETPYLVEDAADLNAVRNKLGASYLQTKDIALSGEWEPIGTEKVPFTGLYDGGDFGISGLTINRSITAYRSEPHAIGLFGYSNGIIRNVHLKSGSINVSFTTTTPAYIASLVGGSAIEGDVNAFRNCSNDGVSISITCIGAFIHNPYVGGVFGLVNTNVYNCHNSQPISVTSNFLPNGITCGGVIGYHSRGATYDCSNAGDISFSYNGPEITNNARIQTGQICGISYSGGCYRCKNTGNLSRAGGIYGICNSYAYDSYNSGVIDGGTCYGICSNTCQRSYNLADITGYGPVYGCSSYYVYDCFNSGNLTSTENTVQGIGGSRSHRCYNSGNLTGFSGGYGISSASAPNIQNCYSLGSKIKRLPGSTVHDKWYKVGPTGGTNSFALDTLVLEFL